MEYWVIRVSNGEAVTVQKCKNRVEGEEWVEKFSKAGLGEHYIQEIDEDKRET